MANEPPNLAYLIVRDGTKWSDVFRLQPGRTVTLGRSATNQIVIKDERASRQHAELFAAEGQWILRDLASRNGTKVGTQAIEGDYVLKPGDVIRIAQYQLTFVENLEEGLGRRLEEDSTEGLSGAAAKAKGATTATGGDLHVLQPEEPAVITHRRDRTRFLDSSEDTSEESSESGVTGRAATMLCRIAFELAQQPDDHAVAQTALDGLFAGTEVDGGGVWLCHPNRRDAAGLGGLKLVATRSELQPRYHKVTDFLARTVLADGEAVLARNISEDSALGSRDSQGHIHSTSVICAPIRHGDRVIGLIHTYATRDERELTVEDLEFTLAVAENVALALANLQRQRELADDLSQKQREIVQLRERLGVESELVGTSEALQQVQQQIARAAGSKATVLIRGESGVGKELVARAIHFSGPRREGPFVCLNCAALTETLLESELFGHEKGAFTGATDRKIGKFEAAHRGTLMLDEIGEMSPTIQAKFLRVLEGHPFERVGGTSPIKVDVRVIAATNRDLEQAVRDREFRRDLYFRLRVLEIRVPPLRKRPDDIRTLAAFFLERFRAETGRRILGFTPAALARMQQYRWPGNVRELKNVIERAVVLCRGEYLDVEDLALSDLTTASESALEIRLPGMTYEPVSLDEIERRHIAATLKETRWNKSRAAAILGIERSTLDRKIKKYGLTKSAI